MQRSSKSSEAWKPQRKQSGAGSSSVYHVANPSTQPFPCTERRSQEAHIEHAGCLHALFTLLISCMSFVAHSRRVATSETLWVQHNPCIIEPCHLASCSASVIASEWDLRNEESPYNGPAAPPKKKYVQDTESAFSVTCCCFLTTWLDQGLLICLCRLLSPEAGVLYTMLLPCISKECLQISSTCKAGSHALY